MDSMLVSLEHVTKIYQVGQVQQAALREVFLEVGRGEFLSVMGPSGCGKSTLLNLMGGLDTPTRGKIWFDGRDFSQLTDEEITRLRGERIGIVFQFFNLLPHLTALENTALPLYLAGIPSREAHHRARELLAFVGMDRWERHLPGQLSGGQQQRVSIARSLIRQPDLLLADEPTGNLDSDNSREVMRLFHRLGKETHLAVVLVTHQEDLAYAADRVIRMNDGVILDESAS